MNSNTETIVRQIREFADRIESGEVKLVTAQSSNDMEPLILGCADFEVRESITVTTRYITGGD